MKKYSYKVVIAHDVIKLREILDSFSEEGWKIKKVFHKPDYSDSFTIIFEKKVKTSDNNKERNYIN